MARATLKLRFPGVAVSNQTCGALGGHPEDDPMPLLGSPHVTLFQSLNLSAVPRVMECAGAEAQSGGPLFFVDKSWLPDSQRP